MLEESIIWMVIHLKGSTRKFPVNTASESSWNTPMNGYVSGNVKPYLAINEMSLSNGESYTVVTDRDARTRECPSTAVMAGTESEDAIAVLQRIDGERCHAVKEVALDLPDSMSKTDGRHFLKPVVSSTVFTFGNRPVVPCRNYASNTVGMHTASQRENGGSRRK